MHSAWGVISSSSIHALSTHHCTSLNSRLHGADYQISPRKIGRIITYIFRHIISLNSSSEFAPINAKSMPTPIIDIADMCCRTEEKTKVILPTYATKVRTVRNFSTHNIPVLFFTCVNRTSSGQRRIPTRYRVKIKKG